MTEPEWLRCEYVYDMLDFAEPYVPDESLRTFAVLCCLDPRVWRYLNPASRRRVRETENLLNGLVSLESFLERSAPRGRTTPVSSARSKVHMSLQGQATEADFELGGEHAIDAACGVARYTMNLLGADQCELLRLVCDPYVDPE